MFTSLVSWLLAALVPGLLMLATLGLGRLEKALEADAVTVTEVAQCHKQADAVAARRAAASLTLRVSSQHVGSSIATDFVDPLDAAIRAQIHQHLRPNPQFSGTRHVNPV